MVRRHRKTTRQSSRQQWLRWLYLALCLIALYVLVPQLSSFHDSFVLIGHIRPIYLLAIIGFTALTYVAAATTYCLLAVRKLHYGRTVVVQVASMFVNRLLPAGIGGIGTNYAYLRRNKHSGVQAASVVTVNNTLGFVGHTMLVIVLLLLVPARLTSLHLPRVDLRVVGGVAAVVAIIMIGILLARHIHERLFRAVRDFFRQIAVYRRHELRLSAALLTSLVLTFANVLGFWMSVLGVHGQIGLTPVLLVFSLGVAVGTLTPTPGGLGGVEAGLVAGLVAYHLSAAQALAAVLAYRLISYWLALAIGGVALAVSRWRGYL